ncbi:L-threonine 3-dehydrogenase [Agrococcus jejuensis]|uniref:L-threonine 3-dehydrogenase n=1 Tax=Agrococcus jejuensis TaxID=399736 RepID=UPI0011A1BE20|nr:L-threonine 3-dehydrogenase [Agrococcus jejuensis]
MRALVTAGEPGLRLTDVPEPTVPPGHVALLVLRAGICGTDLHIDAWDAWAQAAVRPGLVVGHELVGEIVEVADGVVDLAVGQIASVEGHVVCGTCRNCRAGRRHLCIRTSNLGVQRDGAFAERVVVPATNVWVHPGRTIGTVSDAELDVFGIFDPFGNAVHTALKFPVVGEDVLVTGAGPIGLMAAAVARHVGARHILVTDVAPARLELARSMGFEAIDVRTERIEDAQVRFGMREGFDVALEMSGAPSALPAIIDNLNFGGRIAMLGLPSQSIDIDWAKVVSHMLTIQGIYGREMYETWYAMSSLAETGLDVSPVITHRFAFADWAEAFEVARSGAAGKVVLDMTKEA